MELTIDQALQQGVAAHNEGKLQEAEHLYRVILQSQPTHPDANHNLGILAVSLNKSEAALPLLKAALDVNSNVEQFWISYIDALIKEKQFKNARRVIKKAKKAGFIGEKFDALGVQLKRTIQEQATGEVVPLQAPSQAEINSLVANLQNGQYEMARDLALSLTQKFPNHQLSWKVLGAAFWQTGQIDEALIANENAVVLDPKDADAHNNSGVMLQELGRLEEAEASYRKAIARKHDFAEALLNLSKVQDYMNNLDEAILQLENILKLDVGNFGLTAAVDLGIYRFLEDDFTRSKKHLLASSKIQEITDLDLKNFRVYHNYLLKILSWHENKSPDSLAVTTDKKLYVIGESHALASHGLRVQTPSGDFLCKSLLIKGCKQWDLGSAISNNFKTKFEGIFRSLPKFSEVLLAIGEIDCRLDSGIIKHKNRYPEKHKMTLITNTVEYYLNYIYKMNEYYEHNITIQGVPCPAIDIKNISKEKVTELIDLIREFNILLKIKSTELGFGFLDVHKLTDRGDGFSNLIWHIDEHHLSPGGMHEAWCTYFSLKGEMVL